jgi:hypothetical protein
MKEVPNNKFYDKILEEVGEIVLSNTQKLRVLIVSDYETGKTVLSAQKWFRRTKEDEWIASKGFKLSGSNAEQLGVLTECKGRS